MRAVLAVSSLLVVSLAVGCTPSPPGSAPKPKPSGTRGARQPGLYDAGGKRKQAYGVLQHRRLEGGFWVIVNATPQGQPQKARVVVVVLNADALGAEALAGRYVVAEGELLGGVSTRMAGPEMRADWLRAAEAPTAK